MRFPISKYLVLCVFSSMLFASYGCTTPGKSEGEEVATTEEEDAAELAEDESAQSEEEGVEADDEEDTLSDSDTTPSEETSSEELAPQDTAPAAVPMGVPAAAPAASTESSERVVRYVTEDKTPAYGQTDDKSPQVGTYDAGDSLVVKLMGDWAEVTDSYFVKSSALSIKLVPRKRLDPWLQ